MPITKAQLEAQIKLAYDAESDVVVNPAEARARQAKLLAQAINDFVIGRTVEVTGVQTGSGVTTGTIVAL